MNYLFYLGLILLALGCYSPGQPSSSSSSNSSSGPDSGLVDIFGSKFKIGPKSVSTAGALLVHDSLDIKSCGRLVPSGPISKTGTFLVTYDPNNNKYYVLLARKTKQGEIYHHDKSEQEYFGSVIVTADRWGKWVTMGGGYDPSCSNKSSICAARKEIEDEANAPKDAVSTILFLDCAVLLEKPETALFVAYIPWQHARSLVDGKQVVEFTGLQTELTKNLGAGTPYCKKYKCEDMHLFPNDSKTLSRLDLINSSHHEIGFIKWVEIKDLETHELLMPYVTNSIKKFFNKSYVDKVVNYKYE